MSCGFTDIPNFCNSNRDFIEETSSGVCNGLPGIVIILKTSTAFVAFFIC